MNKLKIKKVGEWIHRIVGFTIFESLIVVLGFVGLYISMKILGETNNLNFGTSMGLLQTALAIAYLQVANIFYWIIDINLFDFKKLWRKDEANKDKIAEQTKAYREAKKKLLEDLRTKK